MFCVFTEVLWRKMIQTLSNKTTPHFQLLPMTKVDQPYLRIYEVRLYIDPIALLHNCVSMISVK